MKCKNGFYVDEWNDTLYMEAQEGYWFTTSLGTDCIIPQFVVLAEASPNVNDTLYLPEEYLT